MGTITVTDRVYLDEKGKATTDPEKATTLWATPGDEVSEDQAKEVGYKAVAKKATKVVEGPGGDK